MIDCDFPPRVPLISWDELRAAESALIDHLHSTCGTEYHQAQLSFDDPLMQSLREALESFRTVTRSEVTGDW
jgi:hypothetical protein